MALKERPINADVQASPAKQTPPKPPVPKRRRKLVPTALKLIGATVVVAVVFLAAAVLGGRGAKNTSGTPAPVSEGASSSSQPEAHTAPGISSQLGYPAFATKNTTRVGGATPASNAAGVALATFPAATPAQRPAAVTLVGEDDWQGALAASVLMAAPVRAPVLVSAPDGLPEPTAQAFAALDPRGSSATGGAQAFVIGEVAAPAGLAKVTQVKPGDAAATAAAIEKLRDRLFGVAPRHVVVTAAGQPGFAMPAAAWAARSGDPVLFANRYTLPTPTAMALKRHQDVPVYILGPPAAISPKVAQAISKLTGKVRRVSGEDPVSNAIALARYADGGFGWNVNDPGHGFVVARSDSPLDAAAAAPLSASGTWGPLLLTDSADTLPAALRGYLLDVKPGYSTDPTRAFYNHVWVIGDQEAIDVNQQAEIDNLAELTKIGGQP